VAHSTKLVIILVHSTNLVVILVHSTKLVVILVHSTKLVVILVHSKKLVVILVHSTKLVVILVHSTKLVVILVHSTKLVVILVHFKPSSTIKYNSFFSDYWKHLDFPKIDLCSMKLQSHPKLGCSIVRTCTGTCPDSEQMLSVHQVRRCTDTKLTFFSRLNSNFFKNQGIFQQKLSASVTTTLTKVSSMICIRFSSHRGVFSRFQSNLV
jgi:hypothetical protein